MARAYNSGGKTASFESAVGSFPRLRNRGEHAFIARAKVLPTALRLHLIGNHQNVGETVWLRARASSLPTARPEVYRPHPEITHWDSCENVAKTYGYARVHPDPRTSGSLPTALRLHLLNWES